MPAIAVRGLSYAYPALGPAAEPEWVLRGIDLEIEAGELVCLTGATGAGKSTLALALNGIVPQSTGGVIRGEVLVEGLNTKTCPVPDLARRVGLVFQDPETQFLNSSVEAEIAFGLENLGVPPAEIRQRVEWALALVGLTGFNDRSPYRLSGGQKQRVALASVLAMQPRILVLDEPTASLDPQGKAEVWSVLGRLRQQSGLTIVLIELDLDQAAAANPDRLVVLHEGRIALDGPPAGLFGQFETMQALGPGVPQLSELAHHLNRRYHTGWAFTRLEEACATLQAALAARA